MAAIDRQPENENYISPTGFNFVLNRAPHLVYYCQAVTLPTISMNPIQFANPVRNIPIPDTKMEFSELSLRFRVDEDMRNYQEIYDWMIGLGSPNSTNQYANLVGNPRGKVFDRESEVYSDARLTVLTSHKNFNLEIAFKSLFPLSLSPLAFESTSSDINYLEAEVSFTYRDFSIER